MAGQWLSQEAFDRLKAELDGLRTTGRDDIAKEIEIARDHGDLKENAEYHAAKDKQGHMEARIRQLDALLRDAQIGEPPLDSGVVSGIVVELEIDGDEEVYLVGSQEDSHDEYDILSSTSPIGKAVMGAKPGDEVTAETPGGALPIKVKKVRAA